MFELMRKKGEPLQNNIYEAHSVALLKLSFVFFSIPLCGDGNFNKESTQHHGSELNDTAIK